MRRILALISVSVLMVALTAMPALAANQRGLVNIDLSNNTVQVPVAVAANICDVDVNVLAADLADDGQANCTADADGTATANRGGQG